MRIAFISEAKWKLRPSKAYEEGFLAQPIPGKEKPGPSLRCVTQQHVARPDGRALTDLFFPQLSLRVEVDEEHHKANIDADNIRTADIVNATNHEIVRIDVSKTLNQINSRINHIVDKIRSKLKRMEKSRKNLT